MVQWGDCEKSSNCAFRCHFWCVFFSFFVVVVVVVVIAIVFVAVVISVIIIFIIIIIIIVILFSSFFTHIVKLNNSFAQSFNPATKYTRTPSLVRMTEKNAPLMS